ncbi:hypothetical protein Clacol_007381 [Clathrus columnatus]|uniref:FAS1 domain-containing protein n=1 Tax=Clathrus columnatus TaxID=1419009 RepID=A0AAV5AL16_9AGAM|nr:hypothetical protein Clacol_007381 [Clathrus columnatus]
MGTEDSNNNNVVRSSYSRTPFRPPSSRVMTLPAIGSYETIMPFIAQTSGSDSTNGDQYNQGIGQPPPYRKGSVLTFTVAITRATITIQTENLIGNTTNTVHWTSSDLDTDPESFTMELNHPSFHKLLAIANTVPTAQLSLSFEMPDVLPMGGYSLVFVQDGNITDVLATSGQFFVIENDITGSHTGLVSPTILPSPTVTSSANSSTSNSTTVTSSTSESTPAPTSSTPSTSPTAPPSTPVVVIPAPSSTSGNSTILNNPPSSAQTIKISLAVATVSCMTFGDQIVMEDDSKDPFIRPQGVLPNLADLLTLQTHASIFYSYARDTDINARFTEGNTDGVTIFLPTNKAVQALARKPNDDPHSDLSKLSSEEYQMRSADRQFKGSNVDFTSKAAFDTLTPGITITFKSISETNDQSGDHEHVIHTQDGLPILDDRPIWTNYVLNDGVRILDEKVTQTQSLRFMGATSFEVSPKSTQDKSSMSTPVFDQKDMPFRRLGPSGLRVPLFSLGGWLTLGGTVLGDPVKEIVKTAFDAGINMFDTAESYENGNSEIEMGRAIKELGYRRSDLIISTKIYWGVREGPNASGLSRKQAKHFDTPINSIIEGAQECLGRLQMDYVDVIFAHRCDITVPMEEIVRAFNFVIEKGWAFYWGTSEWTAQQIEEAHHVASRLNLIPPIAEQCQHKSIYRNYGTKTMVFSALAAGLLTGKYNNGIPTGSRFHVHPEEFQRRIKNLQTPEGQMMIEKIKELTALATELGTTVTALSLAWVAKKPNTSNVILGVTSPEQLKESLKAIPLLSKLTPEVMKKIEDIVDTTPALESEFRRRL